MQTANALARLLASALQQSLSDAELPPPMGRHCRVAVHRTSLSHLISCIHSAPTGAMNGAIFLAYVERCLVPTLTPRDIVVMDNLSGHQVREPSSAQRR